MFRTVTFFLGIFDPQLVDCVDSEPTEREGQMEALALSHGTSPIICIVICIKSSKHHRSYSPYL
jgi:hypothetical protein